MGLLTRSKVLGSIVPHTWGTERILKIELQKTKGISVYAPTLISTPKVNKKFQDDLCSIISEFPKREPLFVVGTMNEDEQCLFEVSCQHSLYITNTFLDTKLKTDYLGDTPKLVSK